MPSMKLITLTTATIPITVRMKARSTSPTSDASKRLTEPGSSRPRKGRVNEPTLTPACTGMIAAIVWPSSFGAACSS